MLFFVHINKTGGTTVRHALMEKLPDESVLELYEHGGDWRRVESEINKSQCKIAMGHVPYGVSNRQDIDYATILRDPIDRVRSIYAHHKTKRGAELYEKVNKEDIDLFSFVERRMAPAVNNWMTRMLAGTSNYNFRPVCQETYDLAESNLRKFLVVGVMPALPQFIDRLGKHLGISLNSGLHVNQSPYRSVAELAPQERNIIMENNAFDMKLYECAERLSRR